MSRFANKTAVIAGAGSGIGRAIALRLAAEGASLIILELTELSGEATGAAVHAAGGNARIVACDVSATESVRRAFSEMTKLDIPVNNGVDPVFRPAGA